MTAGWNAYTGPRTEDMATKPTKPKHKPVRHSLGRGDRKVGRALRARRQSKGKQHPLHAESLDKIADDLDAGAIYPTAGVIANMFRDEAKRVRSILR